MIKNPDKFDSYNLEKKMKISKKKEKNILYSNFLKSNACNGLEIQMNKIHSSNISKYMYEHLRELS